MDIETRQRFEEWAAIHDLDLKPGRCAMGEFQYCDLDTDFAWQAWKTQAGEIAKARDQLAAVEMENGILKSEAAKAFASRIADKHLIVHALRDAERYRYLRAHPGLLLPYSSGTYHAPNEVDALVDMARCGKKGT